MRENMRVYCAGSYMYVESMLCLIYIKMVAELGE